MWFLRGQVDEHEGHLTEAFMLIARGAKTDLKLQEVIKRLADRVLGPPVAVTDPNAPRRTP